MKKKKLPQVFYNGIYRQQNPPARAIYILFLAQLVFNCSFYMYFDEESELFWLSLSIN